MITRESEIRVALQAVLISVLVIEGFWGSALLVLATLLPWKPILAVAGYLVQPIVDWRLKKCDHEHQKAPVPGRELDGSLQPAAPISSPPDQLLGPEFRLPEDMSPSSRPLELDEPDLAPLDVVDSEPVLAPSAVDTSAVVPVIRDHLQNLPQEVFTSMSLEVEQVQFRGETADVSVRFQSPNVRELVIRERYVLQKSDGQWHVHSRQTVRANWCERIC